MSIGVDADKRLDTRNGAPDLAFDELTLGVVSPWIKGLSEVAGAASVLSGALGPVHGQHAGELGRVQAWYQSKTPGWFTGNAEGKSFRVQVSPGTLALASVDTNKAEKTIARAFDAQSGLVDSMAGFLNEGDWTDEAIEAASAAWGKAVVDWETGEVFDAPRAAAVRAEVRSWSKRSRMRMVRAVAELDYSDWPVTDGDLAMNTLTYPDRWEVLVPTGKDMKKHFESLRKRWARAIGPWRVLWKLEFQGRGAPHIHFLARVPAMVGGTKFQDWLSVAWASIVGASDEIDRISDLGEPSSEYSRHLASGTGVDFSGTKFSDPRRIALYFLGHSMKGPDGKEYQHTVPELWQAPGKGPGRFWGFSGFTRAVVSLEISLSDFHKLAREFRKLQRARDWKAQLVKHRGIRQRIDGVPWTAEGSQALPAHKIGVYRKRTRALGAGGSVLGGWVLLNDAIPVILNLSAWLAAD